MHTQLCDLLGCDHPVIQAPIGGLAGEDLAKAVALAGGVGSLALTGLGAEEAARRVKSVASVVGDRPFAANFLLHFDIEDELSAALDARPPIVSFFWGDPSRYMPRCREAGVMVCLTVGSVQEARHAADIGCDFVVAQGWEAGGHVRGTMSTLALVPSVLDAVDVPVVAAGGISDGRSLAAVIALGAVGAWVGTAFLAAEETDIHPHYQGRVLGAEGSDTVYATLYDIGWPNAPGRTLANSTYHNWKAAGCPPSGSRPGEDEIVADGGWDGGVPRYLPISARRNLTGDIEALPLWAGQGVGQVTRKRPAAAILADLVDTAAARLAAAHART